jgi:hypothetical protein
MTLNAAKSLAQDETGHGGIESHPGDTYSGRSSLTFTLTLIN